MTVNEAQQLDEQICFALYSASRAITARYREILAPLEITYPQYLVLMVLWEADAATVSGLGERLQLESGTLSPLLRRLETAGHIIRTRLPNDERTVQVTLTETGAALQTRAAHVPDLICASTGMDLGDVRALRAQLAGLAANARGATLPDLD